MSYSDGITYESNDNIICHSRLIVSFFIPPGDKPFTGYDMG